VLLAKPPLEHFVERGFYRGGLGGTPIGFLLFLSLAAHTLRPQT